MKKIRNAKILIVGNIVVMASAIEGSLRKREVQQTSYADDLALIANNKWILSEKLICEYHSRLGKEH